MRGGNSIRCEEKQTKPEIANYSRANAGVPLLAPGAGAHYIMDAWNNGKMQVGTVQYSLSFPCRVSSRAEERHCTRGGGGEGGS